MAKLFEPYALGPLMLKNRIIIPPMCQYSAEDGVATDWHLFHLSKYALSGAGAMILEATAVSPEGRITDGCLGLYTDDQEAALAHILKRIRRYSDMPVGIQLSHAGRKASNHIPWEGRGRLPEGRAWETIAPSPIPFHERLPSPRALGRMDMDRLKSAFVSSSLRAQRVGFNLVELHAAHGYILSAFLSPFANAREDEYGGSLENRMRYPLEIFRSVRSALGKDIALGIRINGTDWAEGGITPEEAVTFSAALKAEDCDFIHVSTGGNVLTKVPTGTGYQIPFAEKIRRETGIPTIGVGMIRTPQEAEAVIADGRADLVAIGRSMLNDPHWVWHAAEDLGVQIAVPPQYERAATRSGLPAAREMIAKS